MDIPDALERVIRSGHTTATLADRIGVTPRTVQRWRTGRHTPSPANLAALRQCLDRLQRPTAATRRPDESRTLVRNRNGRVVDSHRDPSRSRPGLGRPSITTTADPFEVCAEPLAPLPF